MKAANRVRNSQVGRNTAFLLVGHLTRAGIQLVYFVFIARALGAHDYGVFVAATALVGLLAPFATVGAGNLLIMHVARDPAAFARYWGNGLCIAVASGAALTLFAAAVAEIVLPDVTLPLVLCIAAADLLFGRLLDFGGQAFQAFERLDRTAKLMVFISVLRLVAAVLLYVLSEDPSPLQWAVLYLVTGAVSGLYTLYAVHKAYGPPRPDLRGVRADLRAGSAFAVGLSAQTAYNDIDKTMLGSLATVSAAGIYAAAYRIVDAAFKPILSLLWSTYTPFFRHGASGIRSTRAYALKFLPGCVAYGLFTALALSLLAPLLPALVGRDFTRSIEALRWLSVIPLIKSIHLFAADALTAAGRQGLRAAVQVAIALLNVGLNLYLIPRYSWRGAAWASLTTDTTLAIVLWIIMLRLAARGPEETDAERTPPAIAASP